MEIIETFIPTLKYCAIIINFSNSKTVYLFLYDNGQYCMHFPNHTILKELFSLRRNPKNEEYYFDTQKDLCDKVKTYIEMYGLSSIEIEGECGPSTYVYKK